MAMEILSMFSWKGENKLSPTNDSIISVKTLDSPKIFKVHTNRLYDECKELRSYLDATTSQSQPLLIDCVGAQTVTAVCSWLYSGKLIVKNLEIADDGTVSIKSRDEAGVSHTNTRATKKTTDILPYRHHMDPDYVHVDGEMKYEIINPSDYQPGDGADSLRVSWHNKLDSFGRIYAQLMDMYIFASVYDMPRLRRDVTIIWQRFSLLCNALPPIQVIKQGYAHIKEDRPLLKYIILWYGYFNNEITFKPLEWASVSPRFLAGVLEIMYKKQSGRHIFDGLDKNWCEFHEHKNEKEKIECQHGREKDPDVVSIGAVELWDRISSTRKNW